MNKKNTTLRASSLAIALAMLATAVSFATAPSGAVATNAIDLSTWEQRGPPANGNWAVGGGGTSVTQTLTDKDPSYFVQDLATDMIDVIYAGKITTPAADDDFIGWSVLHEFPTGSGTFANGVILDWKGATQTANGHTATAGFTLFELDGGDIPPNVANNFACFWGHDPNTCPVPLTVHASNTGAGLGWEPSTTYDWTLRVGSDGTTSRIKLALTGGTGPFVGGATAIDFLGTFSAQEFGFYTFHQGGVSWSDVTVTDDVRPDVVTNAVCDVPGTFGWCLGTVSVDSSATDGGFGMDTLECRLLAPSESFPCVGTSFSSDMSRTWRATGTDLASNVRNLNTAIRIDHTLPELVADVVCDGGGDPLACDTFLSFTGSASDAMSGVLAGSLACELDGASTPCVGTVGLAEGIYDFGVAAKDRASHENQTNATGILDFSPPEAIIDAECHPWEIAGWCLRYVETSATGFDALSGVATVECTFDGAPTTCDPTERRQEGTHTFAVTVTDNTGRVDTNSTTWKTDSTGPTGAITSPEPGCSYMDDVQVICNFLETTASGDLTFEVTAADALSGVHRAEFWVDGWKYETQLGAGPYSWTWDTADEDIGYHEVQVRLLDNASNFRVMFMDVLVLP